MRSGLTPSPRLTSPCAGLESQAQSCNPLKKKKIICPSSMKKNDT